MANSMSRTINAQQILAKVIKKSKSVIHRRNKAAIEITIKVKESLDITPPSSIMQETIPMIISITTTAYNNKYRLLSFG